jgi:hypothetical protein
MIIIRRSANGSIRPEEHQENRQLRDFQVDSGDGFVGDAVWGDFEQVEGVLYRRAGYARVFTFKFDFGGPADIPDVFEGRVEGVVRDFPEPGLFLSQGKPKLEAEVVEQCPA